MSINAKYLPALSGIFSPIVMDKLIQNGHSAYLNEVCINCGILNEMDKDIQLGDFFDWVYKILFKNYRNEYIYKNVIANKILLGKHSLKTSRMLTELRVSKCKADVVIINGTSTVYEIKSEFDSFARLENQINAYSQAFDQINVITSLSKAKRICSVLPNYVGILVLTDRNSISILRESISNKNKISQSVLFDSLRKYEYIQIIKEFYGTAPDVSNTLIYKECREMFCRIPPETAHDLTMNILRNRNNTKLLQEFIVNAPGSLSAYLLSISNEDAKLKALMEKISTNMSAILNSSLSKEK